MFCGLAHNFLSVDLFSLYIYGVVPDCCLCCCEFMHRSQLLVNLYDLDSRGYSIHLRPPAVREAVRIQIMEMVSLRQSLATISEEVEVHAEIISREASWEEALPLRRLEHSTFSQPD